MTDRELLELSAKAAGIEVTEAMRELWGFEGSSVWNPLADDGDALQLAVKLRLSITFNENHVIMHAFGLPNLCIMELQENPEVNTRRAIVRAAAELGKEMKDD